MQTGCGRKRKTDQVKAYLKSVTILENNLKCMGTSLTQGDHEGRVEQTQICPVRVIHYSPGKETLAGRAQSEDTQKQLNRINKSDKC